MDDYQMIQEGDKIAVGISGGKDSLTLLYAMANLRQFYPKKFSLIAITVDLGYEGFDLTPVKLLCEHLQVEYHIVSTEIAKIIFSDKNEASPCSLCAKLRKGALNQKIKELGCNKVAYAHHMDDIIETMFLSMFYEGQFYSFATACKIIQCRINAGFRKRVKCTAGFRSNDLLSRRSIHCTEIYSHSRCPDRRIMKLSENRAL